MTFDQQIKSERQRLGLTQDEAVATATKAALEYPPPVWRIVRNWLLDDKFMTFRTILSEAKMEEVVSAITSDGEIDDGDGRPDISMVFSADPDDAEMVDVVVVELKRKTDSDKENSYASTQLLQRARKLVDHCPNIQRAWYFAIIEIDDRLEQFLRDDEWTPLYSKGRVFYRERQLKRADGFSVPVPIYLLSFESVAVDAEARKITTVDNHNAIRKTMADKSDQQQQPKIKKTTK